MMATGLELRTVTLRSSGRMARIYSSTNVVPRNMSMGNFSTTEYSVIVQLFPIMRCAVICPKLSRGSLAATWSSLVVGSTILCRQWAGTSFLLIRSGPAHVSRRHIIVCIIFFWNLMRCARNMYFVLLRPSIWNFENFSSPGFWSKININIYSICSLLRVFMLLLEVKVVGPLYRLVRTLFCWSLTGVQCESPSLLTIVLSSP